MTGRTISHYRIVEKLGEGGMGLVYKAEDTMLNRPVALKFLGAHLVNDREARIRFNREAQAAAVLTHPNICTVLEIGEADGQLFIAMAYLEGIDLARKIATTRLRIEETLDIAIQIAMGLDEAHRNGVVHCDIKPANIMQTRWGAVITDFGLANFSTAARLTQKASTAGTISYMSPEQTLGAALDHRTDIWSLGVLLYEMVSGQLPFRGAYTSAIVYSILNETYVPLTELRSGIPIELEQIVGKALIKQPAVRYQRADQMMADLRALRRNLETDHQQLCIGEVPLPSIAVEAAPLPSTVGFLTTACQREISQMRRFQWSHSVHCLRSLPP